MLKKWSGIIKGLLFVLLPLLVIPLASCTQSAGLCLAKPYADLSRIDDFVNNANCRSSFPWMKSKVKRHFLTLIFVPAAADPSQNANIMPPKIIFIPLVHLFMPW